MAATGLGEPAEALAGRRLGPYRILREIGHGGMGTVYMAERADGQYRKRVAIKLVNPHLGAASVLGRFRHERQVLADLDHPNIAGLVDGGATEDGLPYLVMEYVEGERIDLWCDHRTLSVRERLKLFRSVCSAVQYAHERQVIHRDIKPANILVSADGTPKLLDFGIARVLHPELPAQTLEMTTMGPGPMTPEYASPEQVRGEKAGPASDIYALGVVLYYLLTARLPHAVQAGNLSEMARVICEQEPAKPSVASGNRQLAGDLDNIVLKALRKEPERRYASVEQFSDDLDRFLQNLPIQARSDGLPYRCRKFVKRNRVPVTAAAASAVLVLTLFGVLGRFPGSNRRAEGLARSIAVLPLENRSGDKEQEYFVEGITDSLIGDLAQMPDLHVISRTSAMSYTGVRSLPEIARSLGVQTIVEGSVLRSGSRIRLDVRLVDAPKDQPIWNATYEGELRDVLALQEQMASAIAGEIGVTLSARDRARVFRQHRVDLGAYDAYLKGRHEYFIGFTEKSTQQSIAYFQQALALDPNYAPAYGGLADCYFGLSNIYYPPTEVMPKAKWAASKALDLDDTLGEAYATLRWSSPYTSSTGRKPTGGSSAPSNCNPVMPRLTFGTASTWLVWAVSMKPLQKWTGRRSSTRSHPA